LKPLLLLLLLPLLALLLLVLLQGAAVPYQQAHQPQLLAHQLRQVAQPLLTPVAAPQAVDYRAAAAAAQ
jgi:hypothetical protein